MVAEIGVVEGPEPFVFGRIVGVAADPVGHVYVLDEQTSDLRVYSPSGDFLKVVAREGDGPGRIRRPFGLNFAADDRLYVRDQSGVSVFVAGSAAEVRAKSRPTAPTTTRSTGSRGKVPSASSTWPIGTDSSSPTRSLSLRFRICHPGAKRSYGCPPAAGVELGG